MDSEYQWNTNWSPRWPLRSVLRTQGSGKRTPITVTRSAVLSTQRNAGEHFYAMAADPHMNLRWKGHLTRDSYTQVTFKARNSHEAWDFAMKKLEIVPDPNYEAP